ncbi:MAG TPA: organomercurial lyase [Pseudonocardiaceae bacterium]|nr:organomercurial lyase [Pseudonocardiaceae bacterium]
MLSALHTADAIRLDPAGHIAVAYPFSTTPTRHVVRIANRIDVYAMCAIDALGVAAMLAADVVISSTDPTGGGPSRSPSPVAAQPGNPPTPWCSSALGQVAARPWTAAVTTSTSFPASPPRAPGRRPTRTYPDRSSTPPTPRNLVPGSSGTSSHPRPNPLGTAASHLAFGQCVSPVVADT